MKRLSLYKMIKVKLSSFGYDVYRDWAENLNKYMDKNLPSYLKECRIPYIPKVDDEGYAEFELLDFIEIFGSYIDHGSVTSVLKDDSIYIDEDEDK